MSSLTSLPSNIPLTRGGNNFDGSSLTSIPRSDNLSLTKPSYQNDLNYNLEEFGGGNTTSASDPDFSSNTKKHKKKKSSKKKKKSSSSKKKKKTERATSPEEPVEEDFGDFNFDFSDADMLVSDTDMLETDTVEDISSPKFGQSSPINKRKATTFGNTPQSPLTKPKQFGSFGSTAKRSGGGFNSSEQTISILNQVMEKLLNIEEVTVPKDEESQVFKKRYEDSIGKRDELSEKLAQSLDANELLKNELETLRAERATMKESIKLEVSREMQTETEKLRAENVRLVEQAKNFEKRLETELEKAKTLAEEQTKHIQLLNSNEVSSLKSRFADEKSKLQQIQELEKHTMEQVHQRSIDRLTEEHKEELKRQSKVVDHEMRLEELMTKFHVLNETVNRTHVKVNEAQLNIVKEKEIELKDREETLKKMEYMLSNQQEQLSTERQRLQTLFSTLQDSLNKQIGQYEEERERYKEESEKFVRERESLSMKYERQMNHILKEREEFERERSAFIVEKDNFLKECHNEKKDLFKVRAEVHAKNESSLREYQGNLEKLVQREKEYDAVRTRIDSEYDIMKLQKLKIKEEREELRNEREQFDSQRTDFNDQMQRMTQQALEIQRMSQESKRLHEEALLEREKAEEFQSHGTKSREEAKQIALETERKEKQLSIQQRALLDQKERIDQEMKRLTERISDTDKRAENVRQLEVKLHEKLMLVKASLPNNQDEEDFLKMDIDGAEGPLFAPPQSTTLQDEFEFWQNTNTETESALKEQNEFLKLIQKQRSTSPSVSSNFVSLHSFDR
mmetsp:Transcript_4085/g.6049  ORF Transcript_4085/g.6049 Transcript_4085/m.6049 type:complete len:795 (+) Transcript_4085:126-2510(+)